MPLILGRCLFDIVFIVNGDQHQYRNQWNALSALVGLLWPYYYFVNAAYIAESRQKACSRRGGPS